MGFMVSWSSPSWSSLVVAVCGVAVALLMTKKKAGIVKKEYHGKWRICVYGSSSKRTPDVYMKAADGLGRAIAEKDLICVNGGGRTGVMGGVNMGVRAAGGKTLGVIHSMWIKEEKFEELDEVLVADGTWGLHSRKELLMSNSDALIAMPGGVGTLEELLEAMSMRQLNLEGFTKRMPVALVNVNGYYDGLLTQMKRHTRIIC